MKDNYWDLLKDLQTSRSFRMLLGWIIGAQLFVFTGCMSSKTLVTCSDVVTRTHQQVVLKGKLEEKDWHLDDIRSQPVELQVLSSPEPMENKLPLQVISNRHGVFTFPLQTSQEGIYRIRARYRGSNRFETSEDEFTILALTPEKPVMILDVDGTLTQERWNFWRKENALYDAHTVQVVNELATRYAVVYLTARPRPLHRRTRRWLQEKGFPPGPVLVWSPRKIRWLDIEDYKQDVLKVLRQQGINLAVGIGDMEDDIEAYQKAGMKAILLGKEESGARSAYSWLEIETLLTPEKK